MIVNNYDFALTYPKGNHRIHHKVIFEASYPFFIHDYFVLQQQQGQVKNLDIMELGAKDFLWSSVNYTLNIVLNIEKLY